MPDFRAEIPRRAFINTIIIDRAVETESFKLCTKVSLAQLGYNPDMEYQYKNPDFFD
jgi:hypothetical protein